MFETIQAIAMGDFSLSIEIVAPVRPVD